MKKLNSLDEYRKTSLINLIVTFVLFVITIPFFFFNLMEIPLGLILGGILGSLVYLIFSLLKNKRISLTVTFIFVKLGVLIALAIGDAFLYYKAGIKVFNLFALLGGYLVSTVVLVIVSRKEEKNA